mmetsp:Transcript_446/g.451  ORF Transcript_446/g.451 Transcript_446/m.451 type:complete len:146 (+) Transcript_446:57-494(+)
MRRQFSCLSSIAVLAAARRMFGTRYFTDSHEWVEIENNVATVGITNHAQESLGDVIFVGLPSVGDELQAKQVLGDVESVKAASDIYTPVGGKVIAVNEEVTSQPKLLNESAEDKAWLIKLDAANASVEGLMSKSQYDDFLKTVDH